MENLSTAGLAVATGISPSVVLMALDAELLTGHVRLVARPARLRPHGGRRPRTRRTGSRPTHCRPNTVRRGVGVSQSA